MGVGCCIKLSVDCNVFLWGLQKLCQSFSTLGRLLHSYPPHINYNCADGICNKSLPDYISVAGNRQSRMAGCAYRVRHCCLFVWYTLILSSAMGLGVCFAHLVTVIHCHSRGPEPEGSEVEERERRESWAPTFPGHRALSRGQTH